MAFQKLYGKIGFAQDTYVEIILENINGDHWKVLNMPSLIAWFKESVQYMDQGSSSYKWIKSCIQTNDETPTLYRIEKDKNYINMYVFEYVCVYGLKLDLQVCDVQVQEHNRMFWPNRAWME